jgi:uncharacterized membrane protein YgcG
MAQVQPQHPLLPPNPPPVPPPLPGAPAPPPQQLPYTMEVDPIFTGYVRAPGSATAEDYIRHWRNKKVALNWSDQVAIAHARKNLKGEAGDWYTDGIFGLDIAEYDEINATFDNWEQYFRVRYTVRATPATTSLDWAALRQKAHEPFAAFFTKVATCVSNFIKKMPFTAVPTDRNALPATTTVTFIADVTEFEDTLEAYRVAIHAADDPVQETAATAAAIARIRARFHQALDRTTVAAYMRCREVDTRLFHRMLCLNTAVAGVSEVPFRNILARHLEDPTLSISKMVQTLRQRELNAHATQFVAAAAPVAAVAAPADSVDAATGQTLVTGYFDSQGHFVEAVSVANRPAPAPPGGRGKRGGRGGKGGGRGGNKGAHSGGGASHSMVAAAAAAAQQQQQQLQLQMQLAAIGGPPMPGDGRCFFCGQQGHTQQMCAAYKKASAQLQEITGKSGN